LGLRDSRNAFKQALLEDSRVVSASIGTNIPGNPRMDGTEVYPKEKHGDENGAEIHINIFHVDYDYIPTLGIQVKEGRNFSKDFPTDSFGVVINEAAVQDLGWTGTNPIGKTIATSGCHEYKVVGVTDNFHYASLKERVAPLMMMLSYPGPGLIVRIKTGEVHELLEKIKNEWKQFNPQAPFSYFFLDDHFSNLYASELRIQQIFSAFALIAIVIASLGLFGLSAFVIEQRTREIGIRKALGATVQNVLVLVSKEFVLLVAIAFLISVPLTWVTMNQWLQNYPYRIQIGWWVFAAGGLIAILIALLTVSFQAIKAAVANPSDILRTE
jgi:putative ABC transport system permease protein